MATHARWDRNLVRVRACNLHGHMTIHAYPCKHLWIFGFSINLLDLFKLCACNVYNLFDLFWNYDWIISLQWGKSQASTGLPFRAQSFELSLLNSSSRSSVWKKPSNRSCIDCNTLSARLWRTAKIVWKVHKMPWNARTIQFQFELY